MLEIKVTVEAADLASAINNLAEALGKHIATPEKTETKRKKSAPAPDAPSVQIEPTATAADTQPTIPDAAPVNPVPTAAGVHSTAEIAPTSASTANVVPQIPVPAAPVPPTPRAYASPAPAPVPTAAPQYTLDMLATAGAALIDAGKMDQVMSILAKYGSVSLVDLAPAVYGAVASDLRALGAKI